MLESADDLSRELARLHFSAPVACVYNPLHYARAPHAEYLARFGSRRGRVILLGMNPGPFGMAQTGVPFGEVASVRDWLEIEAPVGAPPHPHPRRPVWGFACPRSEVSGRRLWGWARRRFGSPARFFDRFFVVNYCPLLFLEESGRNRTPDKLPAAERAPLFGACDAALRRQLDVLAPRWVVGVGRFSAGRAREVLSGTDVPVGAIPHPSPANPAANRDWEGSAERAFAELGIDLGAPAQ